MIRRTWCAVALMTLVLCGLTLAADKPAKEKKGDGAASTVPAEAVGFAGVLEGKMVSAKPNGNTVTITVTAATPSDDSKVKDGAALVGKDLTVKVRFEKKDGAWAPNADDAAFVKGLKKGDAVHVETKYIESQKALALTAAPTKAEAK